MGLPQLETCCFVLDLKTGNIVLGGINALFSFIIMVIMIVYAAMVGSIDHTGDVEIDAAVTGLYAMCIILLLMYLVRFCFDLVFIYGVVMERAAIIKTYFIVWIIIFLLSLFVFFLNVAHFNSGTICTQLFYCGNWDHKQCIQKTLLFNLNSGTVIRKSNKTKNTYD